MQKKYYQIQKRLFIIFLFLFSPFFITAQTCDLTIDLNDINSYINIDSKVNSSNNSTENDLMWDKKTTPSSSHVAKFEKKGLYIWNASEINPIKIKGIILESGIELNIGRDNNNENPAFEIKNGVIVVKSGSILNISYFTKMNQNIWMFMKN